MQKILIVEDDADIAAIERDYLELNGYQVETAPDGGSGLERGLSGGFDLILLDLMLPGTDGFTVCRRLREETDVPILMVTARREDIDKIRGLGLGADDYIEKPFSPSVLVARVKAHLARYQRLTVTLGGVTFFLIHNRKELPAELPGVDVVVFGHSHRYVQEEKGGLLWLNPGSCGPRRFHQEITMMMAEAEDGKLQVEKIVIPHETA